MPMEAGNSRIEKVIPDMANNAPRKRMHMIAKRTDMTKPHHGKVESLL